MSRGKGEDSDPNKSARSRSAEPEVTETPVAVASDKAPAAEAKVEADPPPPGVEAAPAPGVEAAPPASSEPELVELLAPQVIDTSVTPTTPAPAPGRAPRGDSRSLRRGEEFCLIYRIKSHLIRRQGKVGTIGAWTVTEYPNAGAAAHAYAQECSELTGDGFIDVR